LCPECVRSDKTQRVAAITHDQLAAVPSQPPAFTVVMQRPDALERGQVVHECDAGLPGQLYQPCADAGETFAKIPPGQPRLRFYVAISEGYSTQGRLAIQTRTFIQRAGGIQQP